MIHTFSIVTSARNQMVNIDNQLNSLITQNKWDSGVLYVFVPHTTASVTINENADPDVKTDIIAGLKSIVPDLKYQHMEGNSDSHIKTSLTGSSEVIMIESGKMVLGVWQSVFFCEFDGPRSRKVSVKFIKG